MSWLRFAGYTVGSTCVLLSIPECFLPIKVVGQSMANTVQDHEWVLVQQWRSISFFRSQESIFCRRGDVVVLWSPYSNQKLIKRIVAREGDIVQPRDLSREMVTIPRGHCWIEGDNAERTMDSNDYGPVPMGLVIGSASRVIWPVSKWRLIERGILPNRVTISTEHSPQRWRFPFFNNRKTE